MNSKQLTADVYDAPTLVLGGTGKTGSRLARTLTQMNVPVRVGSRAAGVSFDWSDQTTWGPAIDGVRAIYISYYPDIAFPGSSHAIRDFTSLAVEHGVRRLVLLSGRGAEEAQACEKILADSGADWTVLRCSWFNQNFSEGYLLDPVRYGEVALPASDIGEPFVDADDIADVAAAVLTQDGHLGQTYELTGPRLLNFAEAVATIAEAIGRDVRFVQISQEQYTANLIAVQLPAEVAGHVSYLFATELDGRNASVHDGVESVLGRPPRDFADYVRTAAATGVWAAPTQS
jgi:uncharacterized protein YbjT (DUF2867 family)